MYFIYFNNDVNLLKQNIDCSLNTRMIQKNQFYSVLLKCQLRLFRLDTSSFIIHRSTSLGRWRPKAQLEIDIWRNALGQSRKTEHPTEEEEERRATHTRPAINRIIISKDTLVPLHDFLILIQSIHKNRSLPLRPLFQSLKSK